ncbi:hypothetical protein DPX16_10189 [Anabarilius grahami]|uniref:Uncharacterized protein n=1 Tax=Anabarilius grahami TaxID=495550 RepID=A0A3N0XXB5_ANAGA|nr:hypothetical protein DPX16_10189 [Anabarilius grahami]
MSSGSEGNALFTRSFPKALALTRHAEALTFSPAPGGPTESHIRHRAAPVNGPSGGGGSLSGAVETPVKLTKRWTALMQLLSHTGGESRENVGIPGNVLTDGRVNGPPEASGLTFDLQR